MQPIEFPEQNLVFAKDQPEYQPLPVFYNRESANGEVISAWKLSEEELKQINETGVIWFNMYTFHKPPMPIYLTTKKEEVINDDVIPKKPVTLTEAIEYIYPHFSGMESYFEYPEDKFASFCH